MTKNPNRPDRYCIHLVLRRKSNQIEELRSRTDSAAMANASWKGWLIFLESVEIEAYRIIIYDKFKINLCAEKNPKLLDRDYDPGKNYPEFLLN